LCYLNETPLQAARELFYIHAQFEAEKELYPSAPRDIELEPQPSDAHNGSQISKSTQRNTPKSGFWRRLWQLGSIPRIQHALIASIVVMVSQQLCGVNLIAFYSSSILIPADMSTLSLAEQIINQKRALWLSWGFGLTNFL